MLPYIKKGKTSKDFQNLPVGKAGIFNPLLAPGNVALWDGDGTLDPTNWVDSINSYVINFFNLPTYNAAGLNGHGTIQFNGIDEYGENLTINYNSPLTIYLVVKQITWTAGNMILDEGSGEYFNLMQDNITPQIRFSTADDFKLSNQLLINNWGIVTVFLNGVIGGLRVNLNNIISGNFYSQPFNGFHLANSTGLTSYSNCEFAYIIMRNVADPTWLQNNFINWLKNRFAI